MRAGPVEEGVWLRAERQSAGRGRQGRAWISPFGNLYGSTVVRLRAGDPAPATLGFVAAVALAELVASLLAPEASVAGVTSDEVTCPPPTPPASGRGEEEAPPASGRGVMLKWPNDLLVGGAKLSGILLERHEEAVVVGVGVNLLHHPELPDRPTTSLAAHGVVIAPAAFAERLAGSFAVWLGRWRSEGFIAVRDAWLARAHRPGTPLRAAMPDGIAIEGAFEELDRDGALILRLAGGERRAIHAGDVFLV